MGPSADRLEARTGRTPLLDPIPWIPVAVAGAGAVAVAAAGGWLLYRRHRAAARRLRERRVLDELEDLGVEDVGAWLEGEGAEEARDLGMARLGRTQKGLARRGTAFIVAPADAGSWSAATGRRVLLRFRRRGARHEIRCRVAGRGRLNALRRRRLRLKNRVLYWLVPAGVIVKRERRDMMRFYLGENPRSPAGATDARRFVELQARLQATDVDITGERPLRTRMRADAFRTLDPAPSPADDEGGAPPETTVTSACDVEIIDFSGTGLRVEAGLSAMAALVPVGDDERAEDVLDRLGERALLVTVAVRFRFPPKVADLEPPVPRRIWMLAEAARVFLLEGEADEEHRVRLGLAFLYQAQVDAASGSPQSWEMIRGHGAASDFVVIHNALNQAAARIQSDSPAPGRE